MSRAPTILLCLGAILCGSIAWAHKTGERSPAETGKPLARYTPAVRLVEQSLPSVASIQTVQGQEAPGVFTMGIGSASVIHGDGYLLTNEHVLKRMHQGQALLPGRPQLPFRIIARMSSEDLALIKVEAGEPLRPIPIGRSDDLMLGEPVLIIGNPGGLTHSVSTGVVSGLRRSTAVGGIFLPRMVQTSAAVSGGNSGGPLINALGEQIGVVTSKKLDGENINFAITADRVREMFPALLSAELRYGFALGVEVDMYAPLGRVTEVRKDSPAARAGIGSGDVIVQLDGKDIGHGFDFHLALVDRKPGESLKIQFEREGEKVVAEVELGELELLEPVAEEGMKNGLQFEGFDGKWDHLPDFDSLEAVASGQVEAPTEEAYKTENGENYGLRFRGFLKVPREGLYTLFTSSDDGSRLRIGKEVVVNNDGLHGVMKSGGLIRLKQGLHPVEVTFFEQGGGEELEVSWEGPDLSAQVIPKDAWFRKE
ncbi:MAG: hypothetical protein CMN05_09790 [Roseibacillus sp.]|nr:hypothetical protein [Roseibacillus sp.]MCP4730801.1 PDZ domain-containing protein [Roseibacillus sp.]MDP7309511.1 trypsin-like peptidase domain-containing protein [Roseibacillus sp.]MDP7657145.1 trypsin-like peptidase domain-containing protein [Roseibacillus sp.]HJM62604.1 trypsin-like peptidase domain-containing protein [Roseibacillus sp.]|tara:strand:- start:14080 stop:15525 length:1446 start_codon:yes stop_codon:yes gene_type:complete